MNNSRDPFRGLIWEVRHWNEKNKIKWVKGERRMRPDDGFLPKSYNYNTGLNNQNKI